MALDFPSSPTNGQVFIGGGSSWTWDGTKWVGSSAAMPLSIVGGGTGATTAAQALTNLGAAPVANPTFTGDPKAPTPTAGDADTSLATTQFVDRDFAKKASPALTGVPTAPTPATADSSTTIATTAFVKNQGYAPLASPALSGNPTAPTPTAGDADTSIATTQFVATALATLFEAVRLRVFSTPGAGTYTPTAGTLFALFFCIGAGGGGGGCAASTAGNVGGSGGGGGGALAIKLLTAAQIGASQPIVVGAKGTGGAAGNSNGTIGGDTYVGASIGTALVGAKGGLNGGGAAVNGVGAGGAGGPTAQCVGDIIWGGAAGWTGTAATIITTRFVIAHGGVGPFGGGNTAAGHYITVPGQDAVAYGGGGSGAISLNAAAAQAGGDGYQGVIFCLEFGS